MRGFKLERRQFLRSLPRHVLCAILSGALTGALLYGLQQCALPGKWNYLMFIPLGALYVNGAMLPVALPGKHWSFAFIGAMALFMLLVAGLILSSKFSFAHSLAPQTATVLSKVNQATFLAILTGGCLGLFYGLLAGKSSALVAGLALGAATGYLLGLGSLQLITPEDQWRYDGALNFAWQTAAAFMLLHLGAALGAALGAEKRPGAEG